MTEAQLYEKIGRQQAAIDNLESFRNVVLDVFAKVLTGEMDPQRVMVDLTSKSVCWAPPGERPAMPPTINGLPHCVMAPAAATKAGPDDDEGEDDDQCDRYKADAIPKPTPERNGVPL